MATQHPLIKLMNRAVKAIQSEHYPTKHRPADCKFHSTVFIGLQMINPALCVQKPKAVFAIWFSMDDGRIQMPKERVVDCFSVEKDFRR